MKETLEFIEENRVDFQNYKDFTPSVAAANSTRNLKIGIIAIALIFICYIIYQGLSPKNKVQVAFLPDSTEVRYIGNCALNYSSQFNVSDRTITLAGSAYFDVSHNEQLPFSIKTSLATFTVMGTSFFIDESKNRTVLHVYDGKVMIINHKGQQVVAEAGDRFEITDSISESQESQPSPALNLFTKSYNNSPLKSVLDDLSQIAGIDVKYQEGIALEHCFYNGKFDHASVKQLMEELSIVFNIDYELVNTHVLINSIHCK